MAVVSVDSQPDHIVVTSASSKSFISTSADNYTKTSCTYNKAGKTIDDSEYVEYQFIGLPTYYLLPGPSIDEQPGCNSAYYDRFLQVEAEVLQSDTVITIDNVESETFFSRTLWNGWRSDEEVLSIAYSASMGVTLVAPEVGDLLRLYSEYPLTIRVDTANPLPVFYVVVTITTTNHTYEIYISGTRVLEPNTFLSWSNWREPIQATYSFSTSVFVSSNGTETRKRLKDKATRAIDFTSLFSGTTQSNQAWAYLQSLSLKRQYLPCVYDVTVLEAEATGTVLTCDTTYRNFKEDQWVVLAHKNMSNGLGYIEGTDTTQYVPRQILSVTDTSIQLTDSVPETFEVGDLVFPAIFAEVAVGGNPVTVLTTKVGVLTVHSSEVYGETVLGGDNDGYSPDTHHGFPYLDFDRNWTTTPELVFIRPNTRTSSGRYMVFDYPSDKTKAMLSFLSSGLDRESSWKLRGQINYMQGRYNAFWVPSPIENMSVGATQSSTHVDIITAATADTLTQLRGLCLENAAGDIEFIQGSVSGTVGAFTFDFDEAVSITSITKVRQAFLMRSSMDEYTITFYTPTVIEAPIELEEVVEAY